MIEYIGMPCPLCRSRLRIRADYVGNRVACSYCGERFLVQRNGDRPAPAAEPAAPGEPEGVSPPSPGRQLADAEEELTRLRDQVRELGLRLEQAEQERQQLLPFRDEAERLKAETVRLRADLQAAAADRQADAVKAGRRLRKIRARAAAERRRWREQLEAARQRMVQGYASLAQDVERFQSEAAALRGERDAALAQERQQVLALQEQAEGARAECDQLRARVQDLLVRATEAERREGELRADREAHQTRAAAEETKGQAARAERDRLEAENRALRADLAVAAADRDRLAPLAHELEAARAERDRADVERRAQAGSADQLRARVAGLEQSLAEAVRAGGEEQARWESRAKALEERRASLAQDLEKSRREAAALRGERDAALARADALGQERDQLRSQGGEAEVSHRGALERLRAEAADLGRELDQARRLHEAAAEQGRDLAGRLQSLEGELEQRRRREAELQRRLQALEKELAAARDAGAAGVRRLEEALAGEKARATAARTQWQQQLRTTRDQFGRKQEALRGKVDKLRQEAAALKRERDAQRERAEALARERDRLAAGSAEAETLSREAAARAEAEAARLGRELEQARQRHEAAAAANRELTEQVRSLEVEADRQRRREAELQERLAARGQELEGARAAAPTDPPRLVPALAGPAASAPAGPRVLVPVRAVPRPGAWEPTPVPAPVPRRHRHSRLLGGLLGGAVLGAATASWIFLYLLTEQKDRAEAEKFRMADRAGMVIINGELVPGRKPGRLQAGDNLGPQARAARAAGDEFVEDLEQGRLAGAYRRTSAAYQRRVARADFDKLVHGYPVLKELPPEGHQTKVRKGPGGVYEYYRTVPYRSTRKGPRRFNYALVLVREEGRWKVNELELAGDGD